MSLWALLGFFNGKTAGADHCIDNLISVKSGRVYTIQNRVHSDPVMWRRLVPSLCFSFLLHSWIKGLTTRRHRRGLCSTLLRFTKLCFPITIEEMLFCKTHHLFEAFVVSHCTNKTSSTNTSQNATWKIQKIHQERRVELVNPQLDIKRVCAWCPSALNATFTKISNCKGCHRVGTVGTQSFKTVCSGYCLNKCILVQSAKGNSKPNINFTAHLQCYDC